MGGWYSYIAEYGMKSAKSIGKMFSGSGAKAAEQVAKVSKAELKQVADFKKAMRQLKVLGILSLKLTETLCLVLNTLKVVSVI